MLQRSQLHNYQQRGVQFMLERTGGLLLLSPGMGKTIIALTAIADMLAEKKQRILIVGPLRVVKMVWEREARKWDHTQHLTFSPIIGTPAQRKKAVGAEADIHLINYENLTKLCESGDFDFDVVVFDESTKMKNPDAKRFKAFKKVRGKVSRAYALTGTPAPRGLIDMWAQAYVCDTQILGENFFVFRGTFFNEWGYSWNLKPWANKYLQARLRHHAIALTAQDYLDLPKLPAPVKIEVDLPNKAWSEYQRVEEETLADETLAGANAAVRTARLRQVANGFIYASEGAELIHKAKIEALVNLVEDLQGAPLLLAYEFKEDARLIKQALGDLVHTIDEPNIFNPWTDGEIPVLMGQPSSMGHGLDGLQDGGHHACWFCPTWSIELWQQFNQRLDRQGQRFPVQRFVITARGTVDEDVFQRLKDRHDEQAKVIKAIKA